MKHRSTSSKTNNTTTDNNNTITKNNNTITNDHTNTSGDSPEKYDDSSDSDFKEDQKKTKKRKVENPHKGEKRRKATPNTDTQISIKNIILIRKEKVGRRGKRKNRKIDIERYL